jgi:hypothetical protein
MNQRRYAFLTSVNLILNFTYHPKSKQSFPYQFICSFFRIIDVVTVLKLYRSESNFKKDKQYTYKRNNNTILHIQLFAVQKQ